MQPDLDGLCRVPTPACADCRDANSSAEAQGRDQTPLDCLAVPTPKAVPPFGRLRQPLPPDCLELLQCVGSHPHNT